MLGLLFDTQKKTIHDSSPQTGISTVMSSWIHLFNVCGIIILEYVFPAGTKYCHLSIMCLIYEYELHAASCVDLLMFH